MTTGQTLGRGLVVTVEMLVGIVHAQDGAGPNAGMKGVRVHLTGDRWMSAQDNPTKVWVPELHADRFKAGEWIKVNLICENRTGGGGDGSHAWDYYWGFSGFPEPNAEIAKPALVQAAEEAGGKLVETVKAPASRPVTEGTANPSEWTKDILIVDQVLTKIAADIVVAFTHPETEATIDPEVAADMAVRMWNRIRERHLPPAEEESTNE
jgi:hypothetical protein